MKGYVYIVECRNGKRYIGSTSNVANRLDEHNRGKTKSLKYLLPVSLIYFREYESVQMARKVELKIKKMKSKKHVNDFINGKEILLGV